MKLIQIASPLLLAAAAMAQGINILSPAPGEALTIGQPVTVSVGQGDQLTGLKNVALAIGLQSCGSSECSTSGDQVLGNILFSGSYSPQRHEGDKPPYQNFTFTIPNTTPQHAVIHAVDFILLGAGPEPVLESANVSVTLAQAPSAKFRRVGL